MTPISTLGKMSEFWRVLRDINPESVRRDVARGFRLAIVGNCEPGKDVLRKALAPAPGYTPDEYLVEEGVPQEGARADTAARADLYLYVASAETGLTGSDVTWLKHLYLLARPTVLVYAGEGCGSRAAELCRVSRDLGGLVAAVLTVDPAEPDLAERQLADALLSLLPDRALALATRLRALRLDAATRIIVETSRVNAEFALLSNLPANIPVIGAIMGAGADLLVLTKNQAMMIIKVAAVYGHALDSRWRLAAELAPVVGAAFAWRTVSRLLIGAMPSFVAALPKAVIAYGGTYIVGQAARFYFEHGERPSPELQQSFAREAAERVRSELVANSR